MQGVWGAELRGVDRKVERKRTRHRVNRSCNHHKASCLVSSFAVNLREAEK